MSDAQPDVIDRLVGITPHQFILRTRLHRAAIALGQSDRPVLEIALDAGFADLSTFNRRFRETIGVSPSVYRRDLRARQYHAPAKRDTSRLI